MSRSEFWKSRQAEFEKYATQYSDLEAHWKAASRTWILWWGNTPAGIDVPQECQDVFNAISRRAATELPKLVAGHVDPWLVWLDYMRVRSWGFRVTGHTPCTEREWEAGVQDGKPLLEIRRAQKYTTGDEWKKVYRRTKSGRLQRLSAGELRGKSSNELQKYYHWLEDGTIEHVFESSASLCEDLASRAFEWEALRREFENLPSGEYSLIWSSLPPMSLSGELLPSQWTWFHPTDATLREQAGSVMLKAANARGYDSEEGWLDELRNSKFVKFQISGSGRDRLPEGTYRDTESGVLRDAVKHSITLCWMLEAESAEPPEQGRVRREDLHGDGAALYRTQQAGIPKPSRTTRTGTRTDAVTNRPSATGEDQRKRGKLAADLTAMCARYRRRIPEEAKRQEELIHDARKYAESYLGEAQSPAARLVVTRRIWDEFIPKHPKQKAFALEFSDLHTAVWTEGYPSLEERANAPIQVEAQLRGGVLGLRSSRQSERKRIDRTEQQVGSTRSQAIGTPPAIPLEGGEKASSVLTKVKKARVERLAARLKKLKKESGITWDTIAEESHVSRRWLLDIAAGQRPSPATKANLAKYFSNILHRPVQL
jgi:hypothetical protein